MPYYFMRDTPLQALEQLMMSQPGQKPRGGGIYRSPFHYTPKDVACEYCQNYDRKHPCRLCECTCLEERIEAAVLELNAFVRECFAPSMGPQFRKRMHQQLRERNPQLFLSDAHRRRWTHWRERCWRLSDRNKAALFLLTAYESLWRRMVWKCGNNGFDFQNVRLGGIEPELYSVYHAAKAIAVGCCNITLADPASPKLVTDEAFYLITGALLMAKYVHIEDWRNRPLQGGRYPYVYVDGIYLRRNWGGEYENVAVLVAIAVNEDGFREVLGAAEGMKEDKASWVSFFQWLRGRGLDGVKLIVGDKCMGMLEAVGEVFPDAKYQRCTVHFYRNIFSVVPKSKVKIVAKMLKAIHAQESKEASREKAKAVVAELRAMKLKEAARKVEDGIEETLTYCDFPSEHWTRIRTNNVIERLNREIRRRTRVVGTFPDGNSALMLVCARLRHVAGTQWGCKKYMNMKHLEAVMDDASIAG